jgi:hypothetical protein
VVAVGCGFDGINTTEIAVSDCDIASPGSLKRDRQFLSYCGIKYTLYMSLRSPKNIWEILVSKDKF